VTGGKAIAISWLTFATFLAVWGGLFMHIAIPVAAVILWVVGLGLILRRKKV
jgi:hypothetical protein